MAPMRPTLVLLLLPRCSGWSIVGPALSTRAMSPRTQPRAATCAMGLFDALGKAFSNQDYSQSPATYEQTNARASHVLVASEEEAQKVKDEIAAGLNFSEAALRYSSCASASRGGKLGKFVPGTMAPEFEDVVFGLNDTGMINAKNEAALYEPKYAEKEVHGPVQTKFGWHLIFIETRFIADYDFRLKEEGVVEL